MWVYLYKFTPEFHLAYYCCANSDYTDLTNRIYLLPSKIQGYERSTVEGTFVLHMVCKPRSLFVPWYIDLGGTEASFHNVWLQHWHYDCYLKTDFIRPCQHFLRCRCSEYFAFHLIFFFFSRQCISVVKKDLDF